MVILCAAKLLPMGARVVLVSQVMSDWAACWFPSICIKAQVVLWQTLLSIRAKNFSRLLPRNPLVSI